GVDSMSARDMNLHYSAGGDVLERAQLLGKGAVAMTGQGGAAGRQFFGDTLDILLAADGSLTKVTGRENVRLDLPGAPDSPARSIKARTLDGEGAAGKGLTSATFADNVEYRETGGKAAGARAARARTLSVRTATSRTSSSAASVAVRCVR